MKKRYYKCPDCGKKMSIDKKATGKACKRSGRGYEGRTAKKLDKMTGLPFKATPRSGGGYIPGDIFILGLTNQPFMIECKYRDEITMARIFKNPAGTLYDQRKKEPLVTKNQILIFHEIQTDFLVVHNSEVFWECRKLYPLGRVMFQDEVYYILRLKDFDKLNSIKEILENENGTL